MFLGLRWRLLLSYLMVMAVILSVFGTGAYVFLTRSLFRQLDKKLLTLAQAAAPSLAEIENQGNQYLEEVDEVPWRDIFNRDQQSMEWFDTKGQLLARRGAIEVPERPRLGAWNLQQSESGKQARAFTISVYKDGLQPNQPSLEGFIRASQSTEDLQTVQKQLLLGLGMGGVLALGLVGLGGLWLTQRALEPIEQSFRQLKQFTADASHELRSPLTAIKTSVDVMRNHPERIHPKDAKKLLAIASATTQMSRLVEDLLFLARNDAPQYTLVRERVPVNLNKVLQDLVSLFEPSAQVKNITLKLHFSAQNNVMGDKVQLNRLFANLLENAIQYTPNGGKVTLTLNQQNRCILVSIQDTGIGILPEQLPLIFNRFWRADKARSRREGGTGLGLAIAMAIAQRHGGKITVSSEVDKGSCFSVKLPSISSHHLKSND